MFDRVITLYNFRKSNKTWYGTVISGCTLVATESSADSSRGTGSTSNVNIHVHCTINKKLRTANKTFVSPKEYQTLDSVDGSFTFTPEKDFMIVGKEMTDLVVNDEDFENGFYSFINHTVDDVYMVTNATWYSLLPHFVVGGR